MACSRFVGALRRAVAMVPWYHGAAGACVAHGVRSVPGLWRPALELSNGSDCFSGAARGRCLFFELAEAGAPFGVLGIIGMLPANVLAEHAEVLVRITMGMLGYCDALNYMLPILQKI